MDRLDRIEEKLDKLNESVVTITIDHATKIAKLETTQKGFFTIFSAVLTGIIGFLVKYFNLRS